MPNSPKEPEMDDYDKQEPDPEPHYFDVDQIPVDDNLIPFEDEGPSNGDDVTVPIVKPDQYSGESKLRYSNKNIH